MSEAATATGFVLDPADNVATLPWGGRAGQKLRVAGIALKGEDVLLSEDIPPGHKCALAPIAAGDQLTKYGSPIGRATDPIGPGEHVHVHNMRSGFSQDNHRTGDEDVPAARIGVSDLERTATAILCAAGAASEAARDAARHIACAEASGVGTHGLRRLAPMVQRLRGGGIDGTAKPELSRSGAVISVDGRNGLGHHVARFAADAAIEAALDLGAGVALVRNSNHFGYAGYYAVHMAEQGMVGLVVSNGQVLVGPPGARRAIFSNDPVAVAAPMAEGSVFEFDMATSVTSRARIAQAAEFGRSIDPGLALDADGQPTTDAVAALKGLLLPMGGTKGFGFIAALEVLTGVLPGGAYADLVTSKEAATDRPEGTSHFLMAISAEAAGGLETFRARISDLADRLAALPMAEGTPPPRLPGARRAALRAKAAREGVSLSASEWSTLRRLAAEAGAPLDLAAEGKE